ncbi:MAG: helix-turn-helix transcriptional regulator [bacterium]|nr:helix-turn-helix transcriptional regulator [bacterium]
MGKLINYMRKVEELSQAKLALELGVSRTYLSQVENGHKEPSLPLLKKIASFFQIPIAVLLADENKGDDEMMAHLKKMLGEVLVIRLHGIEQRRGKKKQRSREKMKA